MDAANPSTSGLSQEVLDYLQGNPFFFTRPHPLLPFSGNVNSVPFVQHQTQQQAINQAQHLSTFHRAVIHQQAQQRASIIQAQHQTPFHPAAIHQAQQASIIHQAQNRAPVHLAQHQQSPVHKIHFQEISSSPSVPSHIKDVKIAAPSPPVNIPAPIHQAQQNIPEISTSASVPSPPVNIPAPIHQAQQNIQEISTSASVPSNIQDEKIEGVNNAPPSVSKATDAKTVEPSTAETTDKAVPSAKMPDLENSSVCKMDGILKEIQKLKDDLKFEINYGLTSLAKELKTDIVKAIKEENLHFQAMKSLALDTEKAESKAGEESDEMDAENDPISDDDNLDALATGEKQLFGKELNLTKKRKEILNSSDEGKNDNSEKCTIRKKAGRPKGSKNTTVSKETLKAELSKLQADRLSHRKNNRL